MRLLMPIIAFVIAVAVAAAWFYSTQDSSPDVMVSRPDATPVAVQETTILVARQDIPVGKRIEESDLDRQPWPQHLVIEDFYQVGSEASVIDTVARTPFKAREPLSKSRLGNPNDPGFLAAALPKGMRAVTIPVNNISGIGGFIFPGDRVDVIITHEIGLARDYKSSKDIVSTGDDELDKRERAETAQALPLETSYQVPILMEEQKYEGRPKLNVTEVLVPGARVMAVGRQSSQYENTAAPTHVTVQVTEMDAQRIRHADANSLSLALRSLEDAEEELVVRPVADADMSMLIPPSYFPYLYKDSGYPAEYVDLETVDYKTAGSSQTNEEESRSRIAIVRGTKKEIVGVNR